MQLDRTCIAIRERNLLEILDLSLRAVRHFFFPLLISWLVGVLPLMLLNYWLVGWMGNIPPGYGPDQVWYWIRFIWTMSVLVFIEAPIATVPMTLYLGDAMFLQPSGPRTIATNAWKLLPRMLVCVGLIRGVLAAWLLAYLIDRLMDFSPAELFLILLVGYVLLLRAARPYIGEIVLLERNPLRKTRDRTLTIGRRSAALHNPHGSDLVARAILVAVLAILISMSVFFGFWFVSGMLLNDWRWGPITKHVLFPLSLWMVAGYFCVVRFLSYLDCRIRGEGWEVELRMRAESSRLTRQTA
jgi:hypothetical protein